MVGVRNKFGHLFDDAADHLRGRILAIYGMLLAFNIGAWIWASVAFHRYPVLLGTALLAYGFGLRHAVDADHIAAGSALLVARCASLDRVRKGFLRDTPGRRP